MPMCECLHGSGAGVLGRIGKSGSFPQRTAPADAPRHPQREKPHMRSSPTRRGFASALATVVVAGAVAVAAQVATSATPAAAAPSEPYTWKNVRIDGGGFVPGVIFSRAERNLIY